MAKPINTNVLSFLMKLPSVQSCHYFHNAHTSSKDLGEGVMKCIRKSSAEFAYMCVLTCMYDDSLFSCEDYMCYPELYRDLYG